MTKIVHKGNKIIIDSLWTIMLQNSKCFVWLFRSTLHCFQFSANSSIILCSSPASKDVREDCNIKSRFSNVNLTCIIFWLCCVVKCGYCAFKWSFKSICNICTGLNLFTKWQILKNLTLVLSLRRRTLCTKSSLTWDMIAFTSWSNCSSMSVAFYWHCWQNWKEKKEHTNIFLSFMGDTW